jgi:hypothetical protein
MHAPSAPPRPTTGEAQRDAAVVGAVAGAAGAAAAAVAALLAFLLLAAAPALTRRIVDRAARACVPPVLALPQRPG